MNTITNVVRRFDNVVSTEGKSKRQIRNDASDRLVEIAKALAVSRGAEVAELTEKMNAAIAAFAAAQAAMEK